MNIFSFTRTSRVKPQLTASQPTFGNTFVLEDYLDLFMSKAGELSPFDVLNSIHDVMALSHIQRITTHILQEFLLKNTEEQLKILAGRNLIHYSKNTIEFTNNGQVVFPILKLYESNQS